MRKVIGIGETVFDIIFRNEQPQAAVPGGSTFNALISLGRVGAQVSFLSDVGDDRVGRRICAFMEANGVDSSHVCVRQGLHSPLSLAFLNDRNDAEYLFYKDHPHDRLEFQMPDIHSDDVVIFGSFYALNPVIREQVLSFLQYAHDRGAILYYDVNFRSAHAAQRVSIMPALLENFELADVVRGSNEDFDNLFHTGDPDRVYADRIAFYCPQFICTGGGEFVALRTPHVTHTYPVEKITPVSTIGAGDNFNAGLIYGLLREGIGRDALYSLDRAGWDTLLHYAAAFATNTCGSLNNYVDEDFARRMHLSQPFETH